MMYEVYLLALLGMMAIVTARLLITGAEPWPVIVGPLAILYNWTLNTLYVLASGGMNAWGVFLATDLTCLALLLWAAGCTQFGTLLAATYAGQILMHIMHVAGTADPYRYWQILTTLGYMQIVIATAWPFALKRRESMSEPC